MAGRRSGTTTSLPLQQFSLWVSRTFSPPVLALCVYVFGFPIKSTQQELERANSTIFAPSGFPHDFLFFFRLLPFFELLFFKKPFNCYFRLLMRRCSDSAQHVTIFLGLPRATVVSSTSCHENRSGLYVHGSTLRFIVLS